MSRACAKGARIREEGIELATRSGEPQYGSDLVTEVLNYLQIPYVSLNPGASFRGLHDSIVNYADNHPEMVLCTHEKTAVGVAHGYAKVTGKPMAVVLHDVVGLLHASMGIYLAYMDRVPMLILGGTGPMDAARRRPRIDWDHTALVQGNAVRDFVKWDDQPFGEEAAVESIIRGYRIAMTEPQGPVYICLDTAFQEAELTNKRPQLPTGPLLHTPLQADAEALEHAASWLSGAKHPVILADYFGRHWDSVDALVALAQLLAAPVVDINGRFNFPNTHPLFSLGFEALDEADAVLALDVRDLYGAITQPAPDSGSRQSALPPDCKVIEIGVNELGIKSWSAQYQRLAPTNLSILADTQVAVPALLGACRSILSARGASDHRARAERIQALGQELTEQRQSWLDAARRPSEGNHISQARLALEVWDAIRDRDWALTANTLGDWTRRIWEFDQPLRHPGKRLGTATQIGLSLGIALAHKGSGRLVVDIQPDGDLMYDLGSLWVAAHEKLPFLAVMLNNRSYGNSRNHQRAVARQRGRQESLAYVGTEVDGPPPDFAGVARALGWYAEGPVEDAGELQGALKRAIEVIEKESRPALVDAVVDS